MCFYIPCAFPLSIGGGFVQGEQHEWYITEISICSYLDLTKKYEMQGWTHKSSLTLTLLKVSVQSQESERSCICESEISIFRLDFETVWYVLIFNLFIKYRKKT